jgi:hypothetical protein
LSVGCEANDDTSKRLTVTKPPEEDHGGGWDTHRVVAPVKEKKSNIR